MEQPIDCGEYLPTRPTMLLSKNSTSRTLLNQLVTQTRTIQHYPYDPQGWLDRAHTLSQLHYPELAYGDAWKAEHCCTTLISKQNSEIGLRLGSHGGFWLYDEQQSSADQGLLFQRLSKILAAAIACQEANSRLSQDGKVVISFISQPYPWLHRRHRTREDSLLRAVNKGLALTQPVDVQGKPYCVVRRGAYNTPNSSTQVSDPQHDEAWGVFARGIIPSGTIIVKDKSEVCSWKGPRTRSCTKSSPSLAGANCTAVDLHWIEEGEKDNAARTIQRARCLLQCVAGNTAHPLDNSVVARLRPSYHNRETLHLSRMGDIVIPNLALLQFGIDILANHNFDTWILLTIEARLDNNCCTQPNSCYLNPVFSMYNHSCEPNVRWQCRSDCRTIDMTAVRDIEAGEQLFIQYNAYLEKRPVGERRQALRRWIDGDCGCTRCSREEHFGAAAEPDRETSGTWNTGVASLPEDVL